MNKDTTPKPMTAKQLFRKKFGIEGVLNIPDDLTSMEVIDLMEEYAAQQLSHQKDKELDLVHQCITELYNVDSNVPTIKKYLDKISRLK